MWTTVLTIHCKVINAVRQFSLLTCVYLPFRFLPFDIPIWHSFFCCVAAEYNDNSNNNNKSNNETITEAISIRLLTLLVFISAAFCFAFLFCFAHFRFFFLLPFCFLFFLPYATFFMVCVEVAPRSDKRNQMSSWQCKQFEMSCVCECVCVIACVYECVYECLC